MLPHLLGLALILVRIAETWRSRGSLEILERGLGKSFM